jgi:hypothetical protein
MPSLAQTVLGPKSSVGGGPQTFTRVVPKSPGTSISVTGKPIAESEVTPTCYRRGGGLVSNSVGQMPPGTVTSEPGYSASRPERSAPSMGAPLL